MVASGIVNSMAENGIETEDVLSAVCEQTVALYRELGKSIQAPAIRRVMESVIHQKVEHVQTLRHLESGFTGKAQHLAVHAPAEPEAILQGLVDHESAFASTLDHYALQKLDDEPRQQVKALADASRKFASWAKDHLDLLALF
jgi:hypothetical protein